MNNSIYRKLTALLVAALILLPAAVQARKQDKGLLQTVSQSLNESAAQYKVLMRGLEPDRFPVTWYAASGKLVTSGSEPWVGGFYPGALLYLYEHTGDTALYREALRKLEALKKEQYNTTTHDLGFMMYCSFGNANRIAFKPEYREILLNSARSLASRFNEQVGCIRSWDSGPDQFMVIIDNMVNLELLFAATKMTGDSTYYRIAVTHANTTMKNHFRPDASSHHLVIYDPSSGEVIKKQTVQGASDTSAWARGQAWGLYGYTVMYRETGDRKYLEQANRIAHFLLSHPNLPADKIPYWDFHAPGIPEAPRDVSAAAVICSALLELSGYVDAAAATEYQRAAERMLRSLSSSAYRATAGENGGFILKHGVGNYPRKADIDVPLIYADYYYLEALSRYKRLRDPENLVSRSLDESVQQYRFLKEHVPAGQFPRTWENGRLKTVSPYGWTSGFYPGTLLYLYEYSRDTTLLLEVADKLKVMEPLQTFTGNHDLGFMMYSSYGNAYRLEHDSHFRDILIRSAQSLASRFNPRVGCIESWDEVKSLDGQLMLNFPVIIDNLMNLELLFFATRVSGDRSFREIAVKHAETTMKNHLRPDFSSYHVVDYDPETGAVKSRETQQGFSDNSAWSRGQAWGIYGFTMTYRETGDKRFLNTAEKMADFFLGHPNLPDDGIPYWDFNVGQPGYTPVWNYVPSKYPQVPRDASAAAITASALIELAAYTGPKQSKKYLRAAEKMLKSLSSARYRAEPGQNGGFLLMHASGGVPGNAEVDVPLSYADYYYVEALMRYRQLIQQK
ncbi:MAG: glycoside hydrolase family 88 protein [Prolixibacteraceae bacterium]